ncbi:MAG: hypothetical protein CVU11_15605 [Bacteroidetes bacterium HGW-Bacteroidetes-6]|jgi:hypothetical protein|nr:MAG: hypothetical protein CVU11_15605 [Bacteroidetes bacterium HGW-Bacteroidetes-6]
MKTKAFFAIVLCLGLLASKAQNHNYNRILEVSIVSTDRFEESRLTLVRLTDSLHCMLMSMSEIKDGSKPMEFDIEFLTDDAGYSLVDSRLAQLGHIAFKTAGLKNMNPEDSTLLKKAITRDSTLLSILENNLTEKNPEFNNLLNRIDDLRKTIAENEQKLSLMQHTPQYRNRIIIHLRS